MGADATTKTSPGGIQAQLAIERKLSKPEVIKGLNKMNDEVREGIEKLGAHLDEAKRSGTPEQVRAIKEQLNQWRKKGAYLRRFREHYVLNLDTDKFLTGRKGSSEDLYYKIQDALAQRAKPMSDAEYRSFLERGLGRRGSGGFGVSQRERAKEILEDTAFNLRANAEVVAEKKSRAGKLKIKAKTKQEEELVQQAQREARIRKVLSE
jgi:hypothetical protein